MMETIEVRPCAPEDKSKWIEFLDKNFGYEKNQSYSVDFAPYFEPTALSHSRLLWSGSEIASSASLYPVRMRSFGKVYNLGIIGAVATDEKFRGQGFSTKIIQEMELLAKTLGLDAVILWSDQIDFYKKLGFESAGDQKIYFLQKFPEFSADSMPDGVAAYGWDIRQVATLYSQHPMRLERGIENWQAISKIRSCTRVQWLDESGKVRAYLGFNRGKDLQGIIHEWGGEATYLTALVDQVLRNHPNLCWLTHPKLEDAIVMQLPADEKAIEGSLCLLKPIKQGFQLHSEHPLWFWGLDSL